MISPISYLDILKQRGKIFYNMEKQILYIATDWWLIATTILAGILTAISTFMAVWYTNKKTVERYKEDKERQNKLDSMVIIKPTIRYCSFLNIIDELILYNIRDRVLLISSDFDGFDFFEDSKLSIQNHRIFCIKNESKKNINLIQIEMRSELKTSSDVKIENTVSNFIKLLRSNEEIVFRMHSTAQRNKLWEELQQNKQVDLLFHCTINYLTAAEEQICYEYVTQITHIPNKKDINGEVLFTYKIEVTKDEYKILDKVTLSYRDDIPASVFRNLQDYTNIDRVAHIHKKIGAAQAYGAFKMIFSVPNNSES